MFKTFLSQDKDFIEMCYLSEIYWAGANLSHFNCVFVIRTENLPINQRLVFC